MSDFLNLIILDDECGKIEKVNHYEFRNKPFANTDTFLAPVKNFELLSNGKDVKRVYDLKLSIKDNSYDFLPGDAIAILPQNNQDEINKILIRLNIEDIADKPYKLEISTNTVKKNPTLPKHIPNSGIVRDIFTYYIDIRKPPKKLFLKTLVQFTKDVNEIERLQTICSPKGSKEYSELISGSAQTLTGLLETFTTCFPPIEVILEHSLPLHPRYFSISSSPFEKDLHITFFIVENDDGTKGVCTGWLEDLFQQNKWRFEKIPIYFRKPTGFRISTDLSIPLIMIATGTGLAPFKGFLDHQLLSKMNGEKDIGEALLFYGCRYSDRDFIYSKEIEGYLKEGVLTKLYTAFSRSSDKKCYVQDRIKENAQEVIDYILHKNAIIYVCGDMKTMVKDVKAVLVENLVRYGEFEQATAEGYLNELIQENRFIVDIWL